MRGASRTGGANVSATRTRFAVDVLDGDVVTTGETLLETVRDTYDQADPDRCWPVLPSSRRPGYKCDRDGGSANAGSSSLPAPMSSHHVRCPGTAGF